MNKQGTKQKGFRFCPPGYVWQQERNTMCMLWVGSLFFSFDYPVRLVNAYESLFSYTDEGIRYIQEGVLMDSFGVMIEGCLYSFLITACLPVLFVLYRYFHFYQGSKSIYLMRRLREKSLRWKNCLIVPVLESLISLLIGFLLCLLYMGLYLLVTPKECLGAFWWR